MVITLDLAPRNFDQDRDGRVSLAEWLHAQLAGLTLDVVSDGATSQAASNSNSKSNLAAPRPLDMYLAEFGIRHWIKAMAVHIAHHA